MPTFDNGLCSLGQARSRNSQFHFGGARYHPQRLQALVLAFMDTLPMEFPACSPFRILIQGCRSQTPGFPSPTTLSPAPYTSESANSAETSDSDGDGEVDWAYDG
jgi:hypothetical protein